MGILGGTDVAAMLADLAEAGGGVAVTLGAITVPGLLDREAAEHFGGEMPALVGADEVVHVQAGSLSETLAPGASITVDGAPYAVLKILPYGDGAMIALALRKR